MLIKCRQCGLEYSYGRNICHICEDHSIFFGALLNGIRREYPWNCNCDYNSISAEIKYRPIESKTRMSLKDAKFIMQERIEHKWNCNSFAGKHE